MKVRDVASSAVVAVGPTSSLREATQLMAKHRVGSAVVQDAEMLVGILTERDVLLPLCVTPARGFQGLKILRAGVKEHTFANSDR